MKTLSKNRMGHEPVLPLLLRMSLPIIFSMFVSSLYNVVDSYFVAQVSEKALRAVSLAYPIQLIIIAFGVGTGVGINAFAARLLGQGEIRKASNVASHGALLALVTAVFFALFGLFGVDVLFSTFTNDPEVYAMGVDYTKIVTIFSVGSILQISQEKTIQSTGKMLVPMLSQLVGSITNIILDPIFIFGYFGLPAMGVRGAAIATIIGQFVGAGICLYYLFAYDGEIKISWKVFDFDWNIIKIIYKVGFPSILMQSIGGFLNMGFNYILIPISEVAVSVLGIYYKLQSFVFLPIFGLMQGVLPMVAFNYGARKRSRIDETLRNGLRIAVIMMVVGTAIFLLFPRELLSIFNSTPEMFEIGIPMLRITSLCFIPAALGIMYSTFFQAMGDGIYSLIMSILRQVVVILPLAKILSYLSLSSIWFSYPIAELISLVYGYVIYRRLYDRKVKNLEIVEDLNVLDS